jgi:hypothetical protein
MGGYTACEPVSCVGYEVVCDKESFPKGLYKKFYNYVENGEWIDYREDRDSEDSDSEDSDNEDSDNEDSDESIEGFLKYASNKMYDNVGELVCEYLKYEDKKNCVGEIMQCAQPYEEPSLLIEVRTIPMVGDAPEKWLKMAQELVDLKELLVNLGFDIMYKRWCVAQGNWGY